MKKRLLLMISFLSIFSIAQIPTGYYDSAAGLSGAALKTKLSQIITAGHTDRGYSGLWTGYKTTDIDQTYENDGSILDMYSENPTGTDPYKFTPGTSQCGTYSSEGDCYNREHVIPQSFFNSNAPMVSDINFIRATDGKVNGMRSDYPYGKVGSASYTSQNGSKLGSSISANYTGTVFEPIDEFKGDIARMIFYFVTRYESQLSGFSSGGILGSSAYPGLTSWEKDVLIAWHNADPVSQAEINRNNASYTFQGNRNPYIDHPEYVNSVWGTPVSDTEAPTTPTNLALGTITSNSIALSWTASTDNVAVSGYDIYVDGVLKTTVAGTTATISGLNPLTTYNFYVIAKDSSGNSSTSSNTVTGTTLEGTGGGTTSCGTENFETMPANSSTYTTYTWTSAGITWTATDARTDQTLNTRAIAVRNGSLTSSTISGGIGSLTVTTKQVFTSGSAGTFNLLINGTNVGSIPYNAAGGASTTTTISNLNTTGNITISLVNTITSTRVAIDDLSWTCYSGTLSSNDVSKNKNYIIYPNPIKNGEIFFSGDDLQKIKNVEIYSLDGKLVKKFATPFNKNNSVKVNNLSKGVYILKTDKFSQKIIIE